MKRRNCCDPQGNANELFKCEAAGSEKSKLEIPDMMTNVNVVLIPKHNKSNAHLLENQRGVFLLSVYRSILMKLLLVDKYEDIDLFMSDSNAGGRKNRRAQDHLFIIHGIDFEHAKSLSKKQILEPYTYKDVVEIPALGWIDDVITVSESGHKTARMNSFINAQLVTKKLRLGAKKVQFNACGQQT